MRNNFSAKLRCAAAAALLLAEAAAAAPVAEPFAYPESLLSGRPSAAAPVTTGMQLGPETVTLEKTPLRELAKKLASPLRREGAGDFTRDWMCLKAGSASAPVYVWLIASASPAVTEAQLSSVPPKSGTCSPVPAAYLPASLRGIVPGSSRETVAKTFGAADYSSEDWLFWAESRRLEEFSNSRIQMNWTGVQFDRQGKAVRLFSSQVTAP